MDQYPQESNQYTQDPSRSDRRPFHAFVCVCAAAFGIFLWLKLKLVASVPKSAFAEPEEPLLERAVEVLPSPVSEPPAEIPLTAAELQTPPEAAQPDLIRIVPW